MMFSRLSLNAFPVSKLLYLHSELAAVELHEMSVDVEEFSSWVGSAMLNSARTYDDSYHAKVFVARVLKCLRYDFIQKYHNK